MKRLIYLLLLMVLPLFAEEEIRVHLPTAQALEPLYIATLQADTSFDFAYCRDLDAILAYDLQHNGHTHVLPRSHDKEERLKTSDPNAWRETGASYTIKTKIQSGKLTSSVFTAKTGTLKSFSEIPLSGHLASDRRQIHRLADTIQKALFGTEGVASSRILYSYQVKNPRPDGKEWLSEIWECDWDGANARQVTHDASYSVTPVLMPHSSRFNNDHFLYVSYLAGQPKIYLGSLSGKPTKRLVDLRGNQLLPAISPKRDKLAFICDAGGRTDLFLQPFHPTTGEVGKPIQLFSYPRSTQASPTFSPDGSQIAFVSDKDGGMRIYLIPTTLTEKRANARLLTKQNRENSCPNWSPDGTKLAYSAKTNGIRQIWIYDFATDEESQLTAGPGNKENPCWAPDSKHIVFNSTDKGESELYVVNLNQSEAVKISRGPGKKHYPTWGAR
ncbi:MAG: Tol-Pal system protein TolB [Verrucomicrobia bacterium]|nr:Tol-Pal system protein TolB [Verrucomicrobiota bacterium]